MGGFSSLTGSNGTELQYAVAVLALLVRLDVFFDLNTFI